jgi:hypothetical protein
LQNHIQTRPKNEDEESLNVLFKSASSLSDWQLAELGNATGQFDLEDFDPDVTLLNTDITYTTLSISTSRVLTVAAKSPPKGMDRLRVLAPTRVKTEGLPSYKSTEYKECPTPIFEND